TTAFAGSFNNGLTVLTTVKAFDLPDVGFHLSFEKLLDAADHERRSNLEIINFFVPADAVKLSFFRRYKELNHEQAAATGVQIVRKLSQFPQLPAIHGGITFRVVTYKNFAERRSERFYVCREIFPVFELEFLLAALFCGTRCRIAVCR